MALLQYPIQNTTEKRVWLMQSPQKGLIKYIVKKGSQHKMKSPTMIARVLAAVGVKNLIQNLADSFKVEAHITDEFRRFLS